MTLNCFIYDIKVIKIKKLWETSNTLQHALFRLLQASTIKCGFGMQCNKPYDKLDPWLRFSVQEAVRTCTCDCFSPA